MKFKLSKILLAFGLLTSSLVACNKNKSSEQPNSSEAPASSSVAPSSQSNAGSSNNNNTSSAANTSSEAASSSEEQPKDPKDISLDLLDELETWTVQQVMSYSYTIDEQPFTNVFSSKALIKLAGDNLQQDIDYLVGQTGTNDALLAYYNESTHQDPELTWDQFKETTAYAGMKDYIDEEKGTFLMPQSQQKGTQYLMYDATLKEHYAITQMGALISSEYIIDTEWDDYYADEVDFSDYLEIIAGTIEQGVFNKNTNTYTMFIPAEYQAQMGGIKAFKVVVDENNVPTKLAFDQDADAIAASVAKNESVEASKVHVADVVYEFNISDINKTTITAPQVEIGCKGGVHPEYRYESREDGHRKYCADCYKYLADAEAHNFEGDDHLCFTCGSIEGESEDFVYDVKIAETEKYDLYAFRYYESSVTQRKYNISLMETKSKDSSNPSSLSLNNRAFDGGYRLYWANQDTAEKTGYLFQITLVSDWAPLKADKCYIERAYNIKYYGEVTFTVDGEDNVLIGTQTVAEWAAAQEAPVKNYDGYDLYQDHDDSAEPEVTPIEGESCKYLAQQTCPVCGEVIDGEIITEHSAISYVALTDEEKVAMTAKVSEFVGSMASMILAYCPADYWYWGTCEGCGEKNLTCPVAYYIDEHNSANGVQAVVFELDEEGEIVDYDMGAYARLPHVFDDQDTCEYCGVVAHGDGEIVILEADGADWGLAYADGSLFDYGAYDYEVNIVDEDNTDDEYKAVYSFTLKGETDVLFTVTETYDNGGTPEDDEDDVCTLISFVLGTDDAVEYVPDLGAQLMAELAFYQFGRYGEVSDEDFTAAVSPYAVYQYVTCELYDDGTYVLYYNGNPIEEGTYEINAGVIEFSGTNAIDLTVVGETTFIAVLAGTQTDYVYVMFVDVLPQP